MQKYVPFFVLFAFVSTGVFAESGGWDTPSAALSSARCQANTNSPTCNTFREETRGFTPNPPSPTIPACATPAAADAQQTLIQAYQACRSLEEYGKAQTCCASANADACIQDLDVNNEGRLAYARAKTASTQAGQVQGVEAACRATQSVSTDSNIASGAIAGACHARKMKFIQACDKKVQESQAYACVTSPQQRNAARAAGRDPLANDLNPATAEQSRAAMIASMTGGRDCGNAGLAQQPGSVAPGSSTPGGTPGGTTPGGSNPPGSPAATKPQSTPGGGNPLGSLTSMLPLAMMAMQMMNQQQQQPTPQSAVNPSLDKVDCSVNPNLAGCPPASANSSDSWNAKTAALDKGSNDPAGGNFNPADEKSMSPASADKPAGEPKTPSNVTVGTVPNGGGGMPGGGGGGAAALGGGGGGGAGLNAKTVTDVLHGMSSGGGGMAAMNSNMNMKNGEGGGGYTYGQGGYGHDEAGLDLSQFLPGGKQDPTRKIAGIAGGGPNNFQIQSKEVNIFSRISERIKARCSQGLLRDCIP